MPQNLKACYKEEVVQVSPVLLMNFQIFQQNKANNIKNNIPKKTKHLNS